MRYTIGNSGEETNCDTCGCPLYTGDSAYESANEDAVFCSTGCKATYERRERRMEGATLVDRETLADGSNPIRLSRSIRVF